MTLMWCRGRSFAAGALVMLLAQFTFVCAAPLVACTTASTAAHAPKAGDLDCCPAGSHPPGQCPLHKREAQTGGCRLTCAAQGTTPFVPGLVGVVTPATAYAPVVLSEPAAFRPLTARTSNSVPPISPPPKRNA